MCLLVCMRPHRMLEARTNNVPSCFQRTWCFVAKIAHKIIQHPWFHPQKINHNQVLQLETHIHTMRTIYSHMCFLEFTNTDGWRKEPHWGLDWHALLLRGLKGIKSGANAGTRHSGKRNPQTLVSSATMSKCGSAHPFLQMSLGR